MVDWTTFVTDTESRFPGANHSGSDAEAGRSVATRLLRIALLVIGAAALLAFLIFGAVQNSMP